MRKYKLFLVLSIVLIFSGACKQGTDGPPPPMTQETIVKESSEWRFMRERMVSTQIKGRDVHDPTVLAAMRKVPRHLFVPAEYRKKAYNDYPLPIGEGQTISQPYVVAKMTELLALKGGERVLEIGTGSGYQAAVLAEIAAEVYTIEIVPELGLSAGKRLKEMGYTNVHVKIGDGYLGWPDAAPFDGIIVTAAPPYVPHPLVEQLKIGALMVLPVGKGHQELVVISRKKDGTYRTKRVFPVRFVPMTGEVQRKNPQNP